MVAETITVYIDPVQLRKLKANNYFLFLAKQVNGQFTVIWQSRAAVSQVNPVAYEYMNTFNIIVPIYQINYGTVTSHHGQTTYRNAGLPQSIRLGQTTQLDSLGLFGWPTNSGRSEAISIGNQLAGNPVAALFDMMGNLLFVDPDGGMPIGTKTLTPRDTYQLWFGNRQSTGSIISRNVSNTFTVSFDGGSTTAVVSFNAQSKWQQGPLGGSAAPAPTP